MMSVYEKIKDKEREEKERTYYAHFYLSFLISRLALYEFKVIHVFRVLVQPSIFYLKQAFLALSRVHLIGCCLQTKGLNKKQWGFCAHSYVSVITIPGISTKHVEFTIFKCRYA